MLQDQYKFLHNALYESLSTADFCCAPNQLHARNDAHVKKPGSESDVISQEYEVCSGFNQSSQENLNLK